MENLEAYGRRQFIGTCLRGSLSSKKIPNGFQYGLRPVASHKEDGRQTEGGGHYGGKQVDHVIIEPPQAAAEMGRASTPVNCFLYLYPTVVTAVAGLPTAAKPAVGQ